MRWQNVSVPIAQGLDTKTDEKTLPAEKLANLENGVFTKGGTIVKRNGYTRLSNDIMSSDSAPTSIRSLHTVNEELVAIDNERLMSFVPAEEKWIDRGRFKSPSVTTDTIDDINSMQTNADCATLNDVTVCAWEKNSLGTYITVINEETGTVYLSDTVLHATGLNPRVVACGSHIHVYVHQGTSLYRLLVVPADIEKLITTTPVLSYTEVVDDSNTAPTYDVISAAGNVYIAWHTNHGSNKMKLAKYTSSGTFVKSTEWTHDPDRAIITVKYLDYRGGIMAALAKPWW